MSGVAEPPVTVRLFHIPEGSPMSRPRLVPPASHVMSTLFMDYVRDGKPNGLTFRQYLRAVGYSDPAADIDGMDDGAMVMMPGDGPAMVSVPRQPVTGSLRI